MSDDNAPADESQSVESCASDHGLRMAQSFACRKVMTDCLALVREVRRSVFTVRHHVYSAGGVLRIEDFPSNGQVLGKIFRKKWLAPIITPLKLAQHFDDNASIPILGVQ